MARRRTIIRVPFLKVRINKKTIFTIFGFIVLTVGLLLLLSFLKLFSAGNNEKLLFKINSYLIEGFGGVSFFIPFIIILLSAHFFNSRKLKLVKPNITVGLFFIFMAILGITQSGNFGRIIFSNLSSDFTLLGAVIILLATFIIGLVVFLDTSIDVFVIFLMKSIGLLVESLKQFFFRGTIGRKISQNSGQNKEYKFIEDHKMNKGTGSQLFNNPRTQIKSSPMKKEFKIKPISSIAKSTWIYPPLNLLNNASQTKADRGDVNKNADTMEKTLSSFGIRAKVVDVNYGPTVTQYALKITMGTKLSKITALSTNLALTLAAPTGQVRIEAPIPGRSLVGIEVPNIKPKVVTLKEVLASPPFSKNSDPLLVPFGLDVSNKPQVYSIAKMPHVLIAGTTGSGKSVLLNAWISTLLFRTRPEELRMILVDPKRVELSQYNGIPNLVTEVIVDPEKIISALKWTVSEMENRYKLFAKAGARNLEGYNQIQGVEKKPYIIFVIDELAELMMFAAGDAEELITRIAQMARATGIHLIIATQRPSVDVITGLMKANIPTRVAFNVSSMINSRVIIDMPGAEKLLGKGDMLFMPPDQAKPKRVQGPFITEKEVKNLTKFLRSQTPEVHYTEEVTDQGLYIPGRKGGGFVNNGNDKDELFDKALSTIMQYNKASASFLQRRLSIGYSRAARIIDQLEANGYVGPSRGSKPREIIQRPLDETEKNGREQSI